MATKRMSATRRSADSSKPVAVQYPESEFSRFSRAKLVEVEVAQLEHEQKWGIGRVNTLVPTEFREKFYAQQERIWAAQVSQDAAKFGAACDGMIRAFKAMSNWAQAEGIEPISKVHAIEAQTHLGIMVIVKDEADAVQYMALRKDVVQVWTVAEIVELVKAGIGQAIWDMKQQLPVRGTVVNVEQDSAARSADSAERFGNSADNGKKAAGEAVGQQKAIGEAVGLAGASGFEDLENDIDLDKPVEFPKMFQEPPKVKL